MLSAADVSIKEVLRYFTSRNIEVALLVPTATGMAKGIMDATGSVRDFLRQAGIHDFDKQPQGQDHKKFIPTRIVTASGLVGTKTSLYRPVTKQGDPRIWVYGLAQHAEPNNVLALVSLGDELLVINASDAGLVPGVAPTKAGSLRIKDERSIDLDQLLAPLFNLRGAVAEELLALLREIAGKWHRGISGGRRDTEVGRLLEELLGIRANSSRAPDYKGIEIKAGRTRSQTRQTLFARVPDWRASRLKSSAEILEEFGYKRSAKYIKQLRCTVSAKGANTQGLYLLVRNDESYLEEASTRLDLRSVALWQMADLKQCLEAKHPETFWVSASSKKDAMGEQFRYEHVLHTRKPIVSSLPALLETGVVTVDHLITKDLGGKVREQGPLFKIWRKDMDLLFPPGELHALLPVG